MTLRFTVLASGSGGNASLVEADGFGVLIDIGLGPRQLSARLTSAGLSWSAVNAVLLTHTHSDHWKDRSLSHLQIHGIPFYCHPEHHRALRLYTESFDSLVAAGLVRTYEAGRVIDLTPELRCHPLRLRHDGGATFGFRIEGRPHLFGPAEALGYVADLGCWDEAIVAALTDVDLLALEFNHDVALESASARAPSLIARVLSDDGHLSNDQAASLLRTVLARSAPGRLRHLVQLHLSRECNGPTLAREAALSALAGQTTVLVHTARQDEPLQTLHLGDVPANQRPRRTPRRTRPPVIPQRCLPGFENLGAGES
jgi:phosphoribosyl 1,2-cyclic phosphodiesterase